MLAMVMIMPGAFIVAYLAHFNAFLHNVAGMRRVACHQPGGQGTHIGAVPVVLNTLHHHLHVLFLQAKRGAGFAGRDAFYQYMLEVIGSFRFHNATIYV
jgi:hypothetical protein